MTKDCTHYIPKKWYANEDQDDAIKSHCAANDLTESEFVRRVVMRALHPRTHRTRRRARREGPKLGLVGGFPFPARL